MRLSEQKSVIRLTRRTARNAAAKFLVTLYIRPPPSLARSSSTSTPNPKATETPFSSVFQSVCSQRKIVKSIGVSRMTDFCSESLIYHILYEGDVSANPTLPKLGLKSSKFGTRISLKKQQNQ